MQLSMRSLRSERPREVPWDRECKVRTRHLEAEVSAKNLEEMLMAVGTQGQEYTYT